METTAKVKALASATTIQFMQSTSLQVFQEAYSQARSRRGSLDETRDIRHHEALQRTRLLLHLVDVAPIDPDIDPAREVRAIAKELENFSLELADIGVKVGDVLPETPPRRVVGQPFSL